jgi:hypothetical protein
MNFQFEYMQNIGGYKEINLHYPGLYENKKFLYFEPREKEAI